MTRFTCQGSIKQIVANAMNALHQ